MELTMRGRGGLDPEFLTSFFWMFLLFTAVLIGATVIQRVRKLYFESDEPENLLETLHKAFEEGDLDKDEFKRVQASLERASAPQSVVDEVRLEAKMPDVGGSIPELD
jgi:hypothetical protein